MTENKITFVTKLLSTSFLTLEFDLSMTWRLYTLKIIVNNSNFLNVLSVVLLCYKLIV